MKLTPERGINIVCLAITAIAPTLAIGVIIGSLTGLAEAENFNDPADQHDASQV